MATKINRNRLLACLLPDVEKNYTALREWHKKRNPEHYERYVPVAITATGFGFGSRAR